MYYGIVQLNSIRSTRYQVISMVNTKQNIMDWETLKLQATIFKPKILSYIISVYTRLTHS